MKDQRLPFTPGTSCVSPSGCGPVKKSRTASAPCLCQRNMFLSLLPEAASVNDNYNFLTAPAPLDLRLTAQNVVTVYGVTCNKASSFVVKNALLAFTKDALLCYTKYLGWSGDKVPDSRIRLRKHNLRLAGCSNRRWVGTILQDSVHLYKKKKHRAAASQA